MSSCLLASPFSFPDPDSLLSPQTFFSRDSTRATTLDCLQWPSPWWHRFRTSSVMTTSQRMRCISRMLVLLKSRNAVGADPRMSPLRYSLNCQHMLLVKKFCNDQLHHLSVQQSIASRSSIRGHVADAATDTALVETAFTICT
ncbi:hypothetical protein V8C44DRAFT_343663 [Trichoderma aethiopicum]